MNEKAYSLKRTARYAGFLYLLLTITGVYTLMYVPSQIMVWGDAAATANKMLAREFLFRTGIVVSLLGNVIFVFVVLALYRLFKDVNERQAKLMVALVLVQIPVVFVGAALDITSLLILKWEMMKALDLPQRQDMAMMLLSIDRYSTPGLELFWGLWLFPLALLIFRSGFLPRFLSVWLAINGCAYVILSFTGLLLPQYQDIVSKVTFPALFGELAFMLWLLIMGAKRKPSAASVSLAS